MCTFSRKLTSSLLRRTFPLRAHGRLDVDFQRLAPRIMLTGSWIICWVIHELFLVFVSSTDAHQLVAKLIDHTDVPPDRCWEYVRRVLFICVNTTDCEMDNLRQVADPICKRCR